MAELTGWIIMYNPTDTNVGMMNSCDANSSETYLKGLEKGTSYTISVAAKNPNGIGSFTTKTISTLIDRK